MIGECKSKQERSLLEDKIPLQEILRMSAQELKGYIAQLALENPLVDIEEAAVIVSRSDDVKRKLDWLNQMDESNRVYMRQESEDLDNQEAWDLAVEDQDKDLITYLQAQISAKKMNEKEYKVILFMMECLDSKGYMKDDLGEIAVRFHISRQKAEDVLAVLQSLEPAGIGARDLKECLLLQLKRCHTEDRLTEHIVSGYLEMVGEGKIAAIASKMGITEEEVAKSAERIKKLNPKPGNGFASRDRLTYIMPDITVVKLAGYYEILLNEYLYPQISVNSYYENLLRQDCTEEVKGYIHTKMEQVRWVMDCISQRTKILIQITNAIVNKQDTFFFSGRGLKPISLEEAAEELGVQSSLIRYAVNGKYLQCTWGIYPINYFFSNKNTPLHK